MHERIFDSTHRQNRIYPLNSLSFTLLDSKFIFEFHCNRTKPPADGARTVKDKSVLHVTNVTSLGEVTHTKKKFGALFLLQWLINRRYKHLSDSAQRRMNRLSWTVVETSLAFASSRRFKTTRGENLSSSSPSLSCEKTGRGTSTTLQPCTHRPQKDREESSLNV